MQCGDYTYRVIDTGAEIMEYYGQGGAINLPETLDSLPVVSVGLCAFIMRTDLTAVTLPKTLRHIGGSAFEGCSALTSITLNDGLETIEYRAFASCTALREVASLRERKLRDIEELTVQVRHEKEKLDLRKRSLDSVTRSLSAQRAKLQRDARNAKASIRSLSQKEKQALQRKMSPPRNPGRNSSWAWRSANCASSRRATPKAPRSRRRHRDCGFPSRPGA